MSVNEDDTNVIIIEDVNNVIVNANASTIDYFDHEIDAFIEDTMALIKVVCRQSQAS